MPRRRYAVWVAGHLQVIVRADSGVRAPYSGHRQTFRFCHLMRRDAAPRRRRTQLVSRRERTGAAQALAVGTAVYVLGTMARGRGGEGEEGGGRVRDGGVGENVLRWVKG